MLNKTPYIMQRMKDGYNVIIRGKRAIVDIFLCVADLLDMEFEDIGVGFRIYDR